MAWLRLQQPSAARVRLLLDAADRRERTLFINIVNLGEVFYLSVRDRDLAYGRRVLVTLRSRVTTISADDDLVLFAASLKATNPISYADAFAAATALLRDLPLVTGDPELKAMARKEKSLKLEWIGA
jgi:predicted nucleic acid-binding protein